MRNNHTSENKTIAAGQHYRERDYWLQKLSGELVRSTFPYDRSGAAQPGAREGALSFQLNGDVYARLAELSNRFDPRLYMVLVAVLTLLLYKYTGSHDIMIGAPTFKADVEGNFVNTVLVLRNQITETMTFKELLLQVKETIIQATENQNYPLETLLYKLDIPDNREDFPLFDAAILLENVHDKRYFQDLKFNILFLFSKTAEVVEGHLEYNSVRYESATVKTIINRYKQLLKDAIFNVDREIQDFSILFPGEKQQLLQEFNDTRKALERDKNYPQLFENQAAPTPDKIAAIYNDREMTYRELDRKTNQLARLLRGKGITRNGMVGVFCHRSMINLIGIIGIFKAGGVYIPIETDYPFARIKAILSDAGATVLLTLSDSVSTNNNFYQEIDSHTDIKNIIFLDKSTDNAALLREGGLPETISLSDWNMVEKEAKESLALSTKPLDLAYIIYTSGTTGKPKGVMIHQLGMINHLYAKISDLSIGGEDIIAQTASVGFDISIWQFLVALIVGGRVFIIDKETVLNPREFLKILQRGIVTILESVPSLMTVFLDIMKDESMKDLKNLRWMIPTGEALSPGLVREWYHYFPGIKLVNAYGPTEASDDVTHYIVYEIPSKEQKTIPVGKPVQNMQIYIVDKNLSLCPIGVRGEICVAGIGVGKGYWRDSEKTAHAFIPNPFLEEIGDSDYAIMYKTGDIGYFRKDGFVECVGRLDYQVKIRGNRLELGEIENRLLNHDKIREAVVVLKENQQGEKYLCSYIIPKKDQKVELQEVKEFLSRELPAYMIPAYIIALDKMPLTPNGKMDRRALPEPEMEKEGGDYVAPTSRIEKDLVEIWQEVLGRSPIGVQDNFFMSGGDSIKSIQIVARMTRAGYKLEIKDIFEYATIADLAPYVKKAGNLTEQWEVTGNIPLTPIQHDFFQNTPIAPHHYNQAVMLFTRERLQEETLRALFMKIQEHHDALRMTYTTNAGGDVMQVNHGLEYPLSLEVCDLRGKACVSSLLDAKVNDIQASIQLEKGPLMKLALFHADDGDRLLIVVHHLVVDGVSWRILFEDIETLFRKSKKGELLQLPAKTTSFKLWAETQVEYANSPIFLKELTYWQEFERNEIPTIKKEFEDESNLIKDVESLSFELDEQDTGIILTGVNGAFGTEINDILLTALGKALKKTFAHDRFLVALEGHGREGIAEGIDVSRTVGWFTSLYPVLLDISYENDLSRQIKEIKESLHQVPNKGIGYGLVKYLTAMEHKTGMSFKLEPQIGFNYLGQFDEELRELSSFEIAKESYGDVVNPESPKEFEFDVSGMVVNKRLSISIAYNRRHFRPETVKTLLTDYRDELIHITRFCSSRENRELTPSDFTYRGLSIETVDDIQSQYSYLVKDIYPLSPMQEGMLFHALVDDSSNSYFEQMSYRLQGELDITLVKDSLTEMCKRHDILRTAFVHKNIKRPLQVVLSSREIDFYYEDISKIEEKEQRDNFIKEFKAKDKGRLFDLSNDILIRTAIFRLEKTEYAFVWSFHHILMDGWCIGILNSEFFEIYKSKVENRKFRLPDVKPYRTYIQWLEKQDNEAAIKYWESCLESFEEQTVIPKTKRIKEGKKGYRNVTVSVTLDREKTTILNKLSARYHVTLNTIAQTLWGILLGKYNGKNDVVFGAVVSGRPSGLDGVESIIGLFINTIPVRICFEERMKFSKLLVNVQEKAITGERYHYQQLAEIQSRHPLKQELIDHIFVFENYPIVEQIDGFQKEINANKRLAIQLSMVEVLEQSNYDFNVVLSGTDVLRITFQYNDNTFGREFVERIARQILLIFDQVMKNEETEIRNITLLSGEEKNRILYEFNVTEAGYPGYQSIPRLFSEQVERTPSSIAVLGPSLIQKDQASIQISYRKMNRGVNGVAQRLLQEGVEADTIVGIIAERSLEMIMGILGILKAEGGYLPIDPGYPQERIDYMLKDSGAKVLVTASNFTKEGEKVIRWKGKKVLLEEILEVSLLPFSTTSFVEKNQLPTQDHRLQVNSLAYIIYTSGTTGQPKGAVIDQRNVVRLLFNDRFQFDFNNRDTWTLFHSYCFDFSVWEMYGALLYGGKLVIISKMVSKDPQRYLQILEKQGVTVLNQTPMAFYNLVNEALSHWQREKKLALKYVIFGGETLKPIKLKKWKEKYPQVKLINMFGITETTVHVTYKEITEEEIERNISNIGKPIPTLTVYVLDNGLNPVPLGVAGELCVGGEGLGRGYLNRVELTEKKFVENPYKQKDRLYKSGDLACFLENGDIQYLGRIDHQVKIRGFRIELGEIENRLLHFNPVKEVVVMHSEDNAGDKRLVAYLVPNPQSAYTAYQLLKMAKSGISQKHSRYEWPNGMPVFYINRNETDFMYREIFTEQSYLKNGIILKDGDCIFDVGANIGIFSLYAHRLCRNAKIYLFEPIPPVQEILSLNMQLYGVEAKIYTCGLSSVEGEAEFIYYPHNTVLSGRYADTGQEMRTVKAFIDNQQSLETKDEPVTGDQVHDLLEDRLTSVRFNCSLKTLSGIIAENGVEQIDLLKIDVEKSEVEVLSGIKENDWPKIRQIVMEVHNIDNRLEKILELLKNKGFKVAHEQDSILKNTDLYNIYAMRTDIEAAAAKNLKDVNVGNPIVYWSSPERLKIDARNFLKGTLPDYMIPSAFILLESIPLTKNNKVDKKSLPPLESKGVSRQLVLPRNKVEEILVKIWEKVLTVQQVGINDNFFELGGDSIKAIQVSALLNQSGYKVEMRDIFTLPVLLELAPRLKKVKRIGDQSVSEGIVPLTPIQKYFFEYYTVEPHYFNQAVMLYARKGLEETAVNALFAKLQEHHDALRMIYRINSEEIIQVNQGLHHPCSIDIHDLRTNEKPMEMLTALCNRIQASINLENGPLMKVGFFHLADGDRLLITIHHLVIDGVSWRILLEDIETLYGQYQRGEKLVLPQKTTSYKKWSEKLSVYANSPSFLEEKTYWTHLEAKSAQVMKTTPWDQKNDALAIRCITFSLGEQETDSLLMKVNAAFKTEINDILLAAFALGLKRTYGQDRFLLALEGHGREEILEDVDITRTVGWFTSIYPVVLDVSYSENLGRQIKEVKETLRRIPNRGIGYGILKYLTSEENKQEIEFQLNPSISFNYLGQFDADVKRKLFFELAKESPGELHSPKNRKKYELDVSGMIVDNRLTMSFYYYDKGGAFSQETMSELLNHFECELKQIIAFCCAREDRELSPSDLTYKGLTIKTLEHLCSNYSVEEIYPLTLCRQAFYFIRYTIRHPLYIWYRRHIVFIGKSISKWLKKAWRKS